MSKLTQTQIGKNLFLEVASNSAINLFPGRRCASQSTRTRRYSNSAQDKDIINKIEQENKEEIKYSPTNCYQRLSATSAKYRYLHKVSTNQSTIQGTPIGKKLETGEKREKLEILYWKKTGKIFPEKFFVLRET